MGVNTDLTTRQWGALLGMIVTAMFPFFVAPMADSPGSFVLGLPSWFWIVCGLGLVMYGFVIIFIKFPGKEAVEVDTTPEVN